MDFIMRSSLQKVVITPAIRGLHTRTLASAPRPIRCFHQTLLASPPQKRSFFTSNHLLGNGNKSDDTPTLTESIVNQKESQVSSGAPVASSPPPPPSSASSKRKPVRATAAQALRLGSKTKQSKGVGTAKKPPVLSETTDSDDKDYERTISSICVAQQFDMDAVQEILRFHAFQLDPDGAEFDTRAVVHARGFNNGDIFVFPSGTVVAWSVPAHTLKTLATEQLIRAADLPHVHLLEMEELEFVPDETRDTSYMKGDVVVLGTRAQELQNNRLETTLAKIAFSSGLARSPKLAVLENRLTDYFENSKTTLNALEGESHHKLKRRDVLKVTGQLLSLRSQLNHYSDITDQLPDMFWDSQSNLEEYYNQIGASLNIRQRISHVNKQIDYAFETMSVLRDIVSEKSSNRLEWIIITLITIEVFFELRRVYRESVQDVGGASPS
ncbi:hypothetical protein F4779DRAFT_604930 [Xylariaceae sp. FL0662B]|nr:hypothetical protein F4779DRAFT_604930 [Xylariaceae sp. FL0662B]